MVRLLLFWLAACVGAFLAAANVSPNQPWREAFAATIVAIHLVFYMWVLPHYPITGNKNLAQILLQDTIFEKSEWQINDRIVNLSVIFWFPLQAAFALALCLDSGNEGLWWALAVTQLIAIIAYVYDWRKREAQV